MITLSANKFIGTLTNLIAYTRALDTQDTRGLDRLLNQFRGPNLPTGDGYVVRSTGIPEVEDLDTANSSILTVKKPVIKEQYIPIKEYKKVQITVNQYLMRGAFVRTDAMAELIGLILKSMQTAEKLYLYNRVLGIANRDDENSYGLTALADNIFGVGGETKNSDISNSDLSKSFEIEITGESIGSATTPSEKLYSRTYNTKAFVRKLITTVKQIERGYYNSLNGVKSLVGRDNLVVVMTDEMLASLDVDLMATLLNSEYLNDKIAIDIITIPSWRGDTNYADDATVLILQKNGYQYGFFYEVTTSFFDPSNLNTNNFLHFAYYSGIVESGIAGTIKVNNMSFE